MTGDIKEKLQNGGIEDISLFAGRQKGRFKI